LAKSSGWKCEKVITDEKAGASPFPLGHNTNFLRCGLDMVACISGRRRRSPNKKYSTWMAPETAFVTIAANQSMSAKRASVAKKLFRFLGIPEYSNKQIAGK